jgi:signal transduction histidine kinase
VIRRLASLRLWLVAAMVAAAAIGLVASRFVIADVNKHNELAKDRRKAQLVAATVAGRLRAGAGTRELRLMQSILPNDQIVVSRGGRFVFTGSLPRRPGEIELSVTAPFPGGAVSLRDYETPGAGAPLTTITLVTAAAIALVILAAAATATIVVTAVRRPVERAVAAARRVAAGDFSARIGTAGPEEFAELGTAFDEMASRLEASDDQQRGFLADLAHEIATPLNIVSGYALALASGEIHEPDELGEIAVVDHDETERLQSLLERLRQLLQLDLAEPGPSERIDLAEYLHKLQTRFAPAAHEAGVTLRVRGNGALRADPRLLSTVLDNLVSNAIRYTPAGGSVTVSSHRRRGERVLAVRDSGIGIAPEQQRRIFDRFYRVDDSRDRASGGTGLGLALARRAARAIGGRIELDSTPGHGTEFRLALSPDQQAPPTINIPATPHTLSDR